MTIRTDIQALGPVLYWPLEDATAPAAADDSGHGHTGVYGGPFTLHQYGPEPGTFAAQFAPGGYVTCTGMPQLQAAPFSVVWYVSRNVIVTPSSGIEMGNQPVTLNRGWRSTVINDNTSLITAFNTTGSGATTSAIATPVWNKWWHAYGLVYNGANVFTPYLDGVGGSTATSTTWSGNLSTDTFGWTTPYAAVVAHIAYFDKALTPANISTIHSYRFDWPFGPMINVTWPSPPAGGGGALSPSDPVVVDINTDLSDIRSAVRRDYTAGP